MNREAFSKQAHYYATYRPVYPDEMYRFIFGHLKLKQFAWDCGTGSGQVAGFSIPIRWTPDQLEGFFNSWSAIQKIKEEHGKNPGDEALKKIRSITGNTPVEGYFPVFLRLAKVHK